jgi:hypothetical protein
MENMKEERRMILEMVSKGEVTVEEGERLLSALSESDQSGGPPMVLRGIQPKRFVILVTKDGRKSVNLRIPFGLLRPALKLGKAGMAFGSQWGDKDMDREMIIKMIDEIELDEILDSLSEGEMVLPCTIIDVDDENGQHVEIILE